jgi:hypothetical protein
VPSVFFTNANELSRTSHYQHLKFSLFATMSMQVGHLIDAAADAAAGALTSLPNLLKRKSEEGAEQSEAKMSKTEAPQTADEDKANKRSPMPKAREIRLEQNRKAARESRRRKKVMIEELQRSVIFFSRANGTLKQQNDELTRLLMQAQTQVTVSSTASNSTLSSDQPNDQSHQVNRKTENAEKTNSEQVQAQAVATQAVYESQGFPAAAARAAALTMSGNNLAPNTAPAPANTIQQALPAMQPGATMQAMANFQQAAAAAMQSAMGQMQSIPGVNMSQLAAAPVGANAQQAYTDTMTALAMQQAAAAAAASGQQFVMAGGVPFMHPMLAWQQQVQNQASPPVITQQQMAANSTPKQDN